MIVDTNVLLRAWAGDDTGQSAQARTAMTKAETIFISSTALCEFVWVAHQIYKQKRADIANALKMLVSDPKVVVDRAVVDAGIAFLQAGGDFADGVIELEGRLLGGATFVTFDKRAAQIISSQGRQSLLLNAE